VFKCGVFLSSVLTERTCTDKVRRPAADLVFQEQKQTSFNRLGVTSSLFDRMANRSGRSNCRSLLFMLGDSIGVRYSDS